jgi:hypothetical protein
MPLIENIPVREYQEGDPYNHVVDNQPLQDLQQQISLVNFQVEADRRALSDAIGTQGSLAARLDRSTNDDGSLKPGAIDDAAHSISEHLDGGGYVRMTDSERSKLEGVASGATDLKIEVEAISTIPLYDSGTIALRPSDSVSWRVSGTDVYADVAFPLTARHAHSYDIEAVPVTPISPDYTNYKVTSIATPYKEGSLRVFVNGVRLSKNATVPVPRGSGSSATWLNLSYTEAAATDGIVTTGRFALSTAVTSSDRVMVDFDTAISV